MLVIRFSRTSTDQSEQVVLEIAEREREREDGSYLGNGVARNVD